MPNRESDKELFAAALARRDECPRVEELEALIGHDAPASLQRHIEECAHCKTELELLRSFTSDAAAGRESAAVNAIVTTLRARSSEILPRQVTTREQKSWWRRMIAIRWLTPAAATLAVLLVVAGIALQLRQVRQPALEVPNGTEVLRSSAISILSPAGDIPETPSQIRWEPVGNAARYKVSILEVDRAELWSAETSMAAAEIPASVEKRIIPTKTLLIQVTAFNGAGAKIAESEPIRFRVLQKVYKR